MQALLSISIHSFLKKIKILDKKNSDNYLKECKIPRKTSILRLLDENDQDIKNSKENIFSEGYFKHYYIDFNKDFPTDPKNVLKIPYHF